MKEGGRGFTGTRRRVGGLLVTAEVALSLVLLAGAGLLIRSFIRLQDVNPGFVPEHLLTLHVDPSDKAHDPVRLANFYREIIEHVQGLPGVQAAGVATALPINMPGIRSALTISPGLLPRTGRPLVSGRLLSDRDTPTAPLAAVINQSMAKRYWGTENPIGKRFRSCPGPANYPGSQSWA
jgi:hypothetical protein